MNAVLGGLGAALMWAIATLCTSRASKLIGAASVLAWVMLVGLIITTPFAVDAGLPTGVDGGTATLLVVSGIANLSGLLCVYSALRIGKVGIVAPIVSTEGAVAGVIAATTGERLTLLAGVMLVVITLGVVLAARTLEEEDAAQRRDDGRAALLSLLASLLFGLGLYATGRLSGELALAWVLLPARVLGVAALGVPLALSGRLRITRAAAPLVLVAGLCEVLGLSSFTLGARDHIGVSAVLSAQFAAIAAVGAYVLFRERLARVQVAGVVAIVVGVSILAAVRA